MDQKFIKFYRVSALPETGEVGGLYFVYTAGNVGKLYVCTTSTNFELYSGLNDSEVATKLNDYVLKTQKIAGIDLRDDITPQELMVALKPLLDNPSQEGKFIKGFAVNSETGALEAVYGDVEATDTTYSFESADGATEGAYFKVTEEGKEAQTVYVNADVAGTAQSLIEGLDYTDSAVEGEYVSKVDQVDGKIEVTRAKLPTVVIPVEDVLDPDGNSIVEDKKAKLSKVQATAIREAEASDNLFATEKAVRDAINSLDFEDAAVDGQYVSAVSEVDGKITVTRAALPTESFIGVQVEGVDLNNVNGKVNWGLHYDSDKKEIQVIDRNNSDAVLDTVDATAFIKDGMVDTASIVWCTIEDGKHVPHTTEVKGAIRCLQIVFNTDAGKEAIHIPLNELTDVYTGAEGEITVSEANVIGLANKTVSETTGTALTPAHGGSFNVVTDVTYDEKGRLEGIETSQVTLPTIADGTQTGNGTFVDVTVKTEGGVVTEVIVSENDIASDARLAEIELVTSASLNEHHAQLVDHENRITTLEGAVEDLEGALADKNVDAEGDSLVSATAANNKVTVAATQDLKDAVNAANSAVQKIGSAEKTIQVTRAEDSNDVNLELVWQLF